MQHSSAKQPSGHSRRKAVPEDGKLHTWVRHLLIRAADRRKGPTIPLSPSRRACPMFDQVLESLRKATEASVQVQQEMFKKWISLFPGVPAAAPLWGEQAQRFQQFQQQWAEIVKELIGRQREGIEQSFKLGLQNIEKAYHLGEVKTVEEMRARTVELWQKCFEGLRQAYEIPLREFQVATEKWLQLVTKSAA